MKPADYRDFTTDGKPKQDVQAIDKRWWIVPVEERAAAVAKVVTTLIRYDDLRQRQYQLSARLYGNVELLGILGLNSLRISASAPANKERAYFNVIQSGIDTLVSKQAKNKPKPLFLTSGGDWNTMRKAKKLDKFVEGIFYENEMDKLRPMIRRDAYIFGDGLVQVFNHHGRVKFKRRLPHQLYVDWLEAATGKTLQLHSVEHFDKDVLADLFKDDPKKVEQIQKAGSTTDTLLAANQTVSDQLTVVESWRLPSGPDAKDGRHSINLINSANEKDYSGLNLLDEPYDKDFFPFAQRPWCPRVNGHWSQGIPEQVQGQQLQLNKMTWVEQRAYHLAGAFKVFVYNGSKVPKNQINNEIGTVITGDKPPEYLIVPPLPPGFEAKRQQIKAEVFEQIGISQLSANSQKPAGLNSGKALREFNDIESERFMADGQADEQFTLDLAALAISCAKDIYGSKKSYPVKVPGRKFIQSIDWKDIDLPDESFVMKIFPVSSLPNDPAGRLQTIEDYIQAGMIDPVTGRRMLDFPDLDQHESLANAMEDWINMVLEQIVDEGKMTAPDPHMKLDLAEWFTLMYYAQGQCNKLDPKRLDMLDQFLTQIRLLKAKAQPPMPLAGPPGAGTPQALPKPAPQSELVQNVPGLPAPAGAMA